MPTASTIHANLREARAEFIQLYNEVSKNDPFEGLYEMYAAPEGFAKITSLTAPGKMQDATGTAQVDGLDSASYTVTTKLRRKTVGIDRNLLNRSDAVAKGEVSRALRALAEIVVADRAERMTDLLETGESVGGVGTTAQHSATNGIPGTTVTFDNLKSGAWTDSAAEVLSAVWKGHQAFADMLAAHGYLYHGNPKNLKFALMYHPAITSYVMDAVNPQLLNDKARIDSIIELRPNSELANQDHMYMFILGGSRKPMVYAEQEAPNMISTIGANSQDAAFSVIMQNQELFQARYAGEVGWGSPLHVVKLKDS